MKTTAGFTAQVTGYDSIEDDGNLTRVSYIYVVVHHEPRAGVLANPLEDDDDDDLLLNGWFSTVYRNLQDEIS